MRCDATTTDNNIMRASKHKAGRESLISGTQCDRSTHLTFHSVYVCVLCGYLKEQHVESSMVQCGAEKIKNIITRTHGEPLMRHSYICTRLDLFMHLNTV